MNAHDSHKHALFCFERKKKSANKIYNYLNESVKITLNNQKIVAKIMSSLRSFITTYISQI